MTVRDIKRTVQHIDVLWKKYNEGGLEGSDYNMIMKLLQDYREDLLDKKIAK